MRNFNQVPPSNYGLVQCELKKSFQELVRDEIDLPGFSGDTELFHFPGYWVPNNRVFGTKSFLMFATEAIGRFGPDNGVRAVPLRTLGGLALMQSPEPPSGNRISFLSGAATTIQEINAAFRDVGSPYEIELRLPNEPPFVAPPSA